MKNRILFIILSALMIFSQGAFALSSTALTKPEESPVISDPNRVPTPQNATALGAITAVDTVKQMIQVKNPAGGTDLSFYVDSTTPIFDGQRRQLTFDALKAGDPISVDFLADTYKVNEIRRAN